MISDELKAISILVDSATKDIEEWEKRGCPRYCGDTLLRKGATQTGIKNSIRIIRRMLLQISNDIDNKV